MGKYQRSKPSPINLVPTGATLLNLTLGGGYPLGKIINIIGDKSTGKTLLACEFIAQMKRTYGKKFKWFYDDAESGFSFNTEQMYGFQIDNNEEEGSLTIEEFGDNLTKQISKLKKDDIFVYILDSLDSLTSEAEIAKDKETTIARAKGIEVKGSYGLEKQKYLGKFFRLKRKEIKNKNVILIIISQVRQNIGLSFGPKYYRTGGKALDFYAAQVFWLAEAEKHYKRKLVTGVAIKVKNTKNKVGLPFRECFLDILFDYGVDDISSNLCYLLDLRTDQGKLKKKTEYTWDRKELKTLSRLIKYIEQVGLEKELQKIVIKKWQDKERSVASRRKSKYAAD